VIDIGLRCEKCVVVEIGLRCEKCVVVEIGLRCEKCVVVEIGLSREKCIVIDIDLRSALRYTLGYKNERDGYNPILYENKSCVLYKNMTNI